jgi:hypothetical protein
MRPLKVTLSKLTVGKRQIDTAIWLWFNDGDVVSIVTLAGAALGVLDGLYQHARKGRPFPFDEKTIPPGLTPRDARNIVKEAENFAKHARGDADKTFDYRFDKVTAYLYCAVAAYFNLTGEHEPSGLHALFWTRYGMMHPTLHRNGLSRLRPEQIAEAERLKNLSRREYFNEGGKKFVSGPPAPDWWPEDLHLGNPPG